MAKPGTTWEWKGFITPLGSRGAQRSSTAADTPTHKDQRQPGTDPLLLGVRSQTLTDPETISDVCPGHWGWKLLRAAWPCGPSTLKTERKPIAWVNPVFHQTLAQMCSPERERKKSWSEYSGVLCYTLGTWNSALW